MTWKRVRFSLSILGVVALAASVQSGNKCKGTVTETIFEGNIACTPNNCTGTCAEKDEPGGSYSYCACDGESEPVCCHIRLLHVFGPDTPSVFGSCSTGCAYPSGDCQMKQISDGGSTQSTAYCALPMHH